MSSASHSSHTLTNNEGLVVSDNQNSITVGEHGPTVLEDIYLQQKLAHFNRERIPERVVHAKAAGAYGTFTVTHDITRYTKAKIFSNVGKQTEVFGRFSTVAGERGSADTVRDVRGFALKFYTEEGNWDIVGNNTPTFFIRDAKKFPDFIHSQKRDPQTNLRSDTMQWDFFSLIPESLHQVTILYSDRGIPKGIPYMHGFGSHTFSFINSENKRFWVKFHFKTNQGIQNIGEAEANKLAGCDADYHVKQLFNTIEAKQFPKWTMYVQIMPEQDADNYKFNPFDITKVWYQSDYPLVQVGVLELNRNPNNYFVDVEQAAFSPSNIVPGISFSPDKLLQGRLFAYQDAQRYRLGVNFERLPVNCPHAAHVTNTYMRDGAMRFDANAGSEPNYEPNSFNGPKEDPNYAEAARHISGDVACFTQKRGAEDDYVQPGKLFRLMKPEQQQMLISNIACSLKMVPKEIQQRMLQHFYKADQHYGDGFAAIISRN
jgi:catalase